MTENIEAFHFLPPHPGPLAQETVSQWGKRVVIPAKAGIQFLILFKYLNSWMPAFAGMTNYDTVSKWRGCFRMNTNPGGGVYGRDEIEGKSFDRAAAGNPGSGPLD